jgi:hypothetical protein
MNRRTPKGGNRCYRRETPAESGVCTQKRRSVFPTPHRIYPSICTPFSGNNVGNSVFSGILEIFFVRNAGSAAYPMFSVALRKSLRRKGRILALVTTFA